MANYNTLKSTQLEEIITIKYINNEINKINKKTSCNYIINLFGETINTADIINKSYTYYNNLIISNSLFINYFNIITNNLIYFNAESNIKSYAGSNQIPFMNDAL